MFGDSYAERFFFGAPYTKSTDSIFQSKNHNKKCADIWTHSDDLVTEKNKKNDIQLT